jgi:NAD(P)-dependent dehydrogenase (short-subunit alcohol dehydrogenase family)
MAGSLDGNVAVVTGGGRGIGLGIAQALLEEGAKVVISQRTGTELAAAVEELGQYGEVVDKVCDATDRRQVEALMDFTIERYGRLDVLAANQGMSQRRRFLELEEADWDRTMSVNVKSMFLTGQAAARRMVDAGVRGRIVLTSSICATAAEPDCAHYNASKGAVSALTKAMALDLAGFGITVNAVAPGWILSRSTRSRVSPAMLEGRERFPANPMGRIGMPVDVGRCVAYFADPRNSFVSGAITTVDGAQTAELIDLPPVSETPEDLGSGAPVAGA